MRRTLEPDQLENCYREINVSVDVKKDLMTALEWLKKAKNEVNRLLESRYINSKRATKWISMIKNNTQEIIHFLCHISLSSQEIGELIVWV
jgi:hypothetical protein